MSYKTLIAGTLRYHEDVIADNITNDFLLFRLLGDKDLAPKLFKQRKPNAGGTYAEGLRLTDDPGRSIVRKIRTARNSTIQAYSRFDPFDVSPQDNYDEVEYDWKSVGGSVHVSNEDLDKNSGSKTRIFDILEASVEDYEISMQEQLADFLLGTVPNTVAGLKRPTGLLDMVQDDPTSLPTGGINLIGENIDSSTDAGSFWRNAVKNHASAAFGTDQNGSGPKNLRKLIRDTTFGTQKAAVILAGEIAFENLIRTTVTQDRYNDPRVDTMKNMAIDAFMFNGIPVVMEKRIDTLRTAASLTGSAFYALNFPAYRIDGMKKRWFKMTQFREPTNQDTQVALGMVRLNATMNARRAQGVMFGVIDA